MRISLFWRETAVPALALFTSAGTLLCCALPGLLVSIGAGAVMAGLVTNVPGLIFLSAHKGWVFGIAGVMLAAAVLAKYLARNAPCPIDPVQANACMRMRRTGTIILGVAIGAYLIGGFFAFFAADLLL
jgi:hypothetical protein